MEEDFVEINEKKARNIFSRISHSIIIFLLNYWPRNGQYYDNRN